VLRVSATVTAWASSCIKNRPDQLGRAQVPQIVCYDGAGGASHRKIDQVVVAGIA
jgi:hypothetical protein